MQPRTFRRPEPRGPREPANLPGPEGPRVIVPASLELVLSATLAQRANLGRATYPRYAASAACDECVTVLHEVTKGARQEALAGGATEDQAAARAMDLTRGLSVNRARLERVITGADPSTKIRLCTGHGTLWQHRDRAPTTRR